MKNLLITAVCVWLFSSFVWAQNCVENARVAEPAMPAETRKGYESKLTEARLNHEKAPDAETLIWLGRRTAYLGSYKEAIRIFTEGIGKYPTDARFYRHRGHRFISIRCFDEAVRDLRKAAQLVRGQADAIEPDGLPNARNIPTSTLQSNIWYHLGLAYYLQGNFKQALRAYRTAEKVSRNPDMQVATAHWLYMTLRRLGREKEARQVVASVGDNLDIIENDDYYKLVRLYQGRLKAEDLLKEIGTSANSLGSASLGYGLGNWFLYNGDREKARQIFRQIAGGNQWASFGYIAAEAELRRDPETTPAAKKL